MVITTYEAVGSNSDGWVATVLMWYAPGSSQVCGNGDTEVLGE